MFQLLYLFRIVMQLTYISHNLTVYFPVIPSLLDSIIFRLCLLVLELFTLGSCFHYYWFRKLEAIDGTFLIDCTFSICCTCSMHVLSLWIPLLVLFILCYQYFVFKEPELP